MTWQFSAPADIKTCDCEVLQNYSAHTNFTWKPWQLQVGGSCVFFWTALFCVGRRNKFILLREEKSFLNLESFITWIISFEHGFLHLLCWGAGAQEVQGVQMQSVVTKSYARQQARQLSPVTKAYFKSPKGLS